MRCSRLTGLVAAFSTASDTTAVPPIAGGECLSYPIDSTLVQSAGHTWKFSVRHMKIIRKRSPHTGRTYIAVPAEVSNLRVSGQSPAQLRQLTSRGWGAAI